MIDKFLTKRILENRVIDVDKVDAFAGDLMGLEEIEKGRRYKVPNSETQIVLDALVPDEVYELKIFIDNAEVKIGDVYRMNDKLWVARDEKGTDKEGLGLLDAAVALLSINGVI